MCLGSISLMEKVKGKFIMSCFPKKKVTPFPKKVVKSKKVTTCEEVNPGPITVNNGIYQSINQKGNEAPKINPPWVKEINLGS